ncbi:hypothetical protein Tco_1171323 [Tanacetum coccineum]
MRDFQDHNGKRHPYGQFLVLSLGTGVRNYEGKYDVKESSTWGVAGCPDNFLNIQDDNLAKDLSSIDKATKKNMEALKDVGETLQDKPGCRANSETGDFEPVLVDIKTVKHYESI